MMCNKKNHYRTTVKNVLVAVAGSRPSLNFHTTTKERFNKNDELGVETVINVAPC